MNTRVSLLILALLVNTLGCATVHRHPTATKVTAFIVTGVVAGAIVYHYRDPSCHEYPPGKNGVGFPCPKD